MICDNCGVKIYEEEEYCPNCGMELPGSVSKPLKRKHYGNSATFDDTDYHHQEKFKYEIYDLEETDYEDIESKPLQSKYYKDSSAFDYDNLNYQDYDDYHYYENYYTEETDYEMEKSGYGLSKIVLLLTIMLIIGFIIGIKLFSNTQVIPPTGYHG